MGLDTYHSKRDFTQTPEPKGEKKSSTTEHLFVVQKHHASQLHYDFRMEYDGVLVSWAVPKGPTLNPSQKRLAMQTEDHPMDYARFEGSIAPGNYGAGEVIVWDIGSYTIPGIDGLAETDEEFGKMLQAGRITFILHGKKLKGEYSLIKTKFGKNSWLMIKARDEYATEEDILEKNMSVLSKKKL